MIDLLLDPDKALDAVNKAVALVKKASKTVDNVESLGPLLAIKGKDAIKEMLPPKEEPPKTEEKKES